MLNTKHKIAKQSDRRGAIVPMFALLLPLLIIFCAFAVNLAYMQVVSTELKIATDCAAHAGGRAMSVAQDDDTLTTPEKRELAIESATAIAQQIVNANPIIGRQVSVGGQGSGADIEVGFGRSLRSNNGQGRYDYTVLDTADVASGASVPSSFHVSSNLTAPLPFPVLGSNISSFSPTRRTVATQVNRDVALSWTAPAPCFTFVIEVCWMTPSMSFTILRERSTATALALTRLRQNIIYSFGLKMVCQYRVNGLAPQKLKRDH